MLVNMKKRTELQGYLFAGERLRRKVRKHFELTPYIGYAFEQMTADVLSGNCLTVNCCDDCCPDVRVDEHTLVESKASCRQCFVSGVKQFENYRQLREEELQRVYYALWEYERTKDRPKTVLAALEDCAYRVKRLIILDFPYVEHVISLCAKMYYITSIHGRVAYYRMTRNTYKPVADEPEEYLAKAGLSEYSTVKRGRAKSSFSVDGVTFDSSVFDIVRIEESIPF